MATRVRPQRTKTMKITTSAEMRAAIDGNPREILEAIGRVVQEAKHHHAGRGRPLRGPGGLPCLLVDALAELERVSETFVAGTRRDAARKGRKRRRTPEEKADDEEVLRLVEASVLPMSPIFLYALVQDARQGSRGRGHRSPSPQRTTSAAGSRK